MLEAISKEKCVYQTTHNLYNFKYNGKEYYLREIEYYDSNTNFLETEYRFLDSYRIEEVELDIEYSDVLKLFE